MMNGASQRKHNSSNTVDYINIKLFKLILMSTEVKKSAVLKGGEWLIKESSPFETFTPEDFVEEQLMIKDMCNQFLDMEVYPNIERIDNMEPGLMKSLVAKAG